MAAPKWMQDVADAVVPDISGRKKAAAQAAQDKADAAAKAAADKAAADKAAGQKQVDAITFKKGGWIAGAVKKPGALRAELGAKPGKPIPAAKLKAAAKAPGKLGQRARLAETFKGMKKK